MPGRDVAAQTVGRSQPGRNRIFVSVAAALVLLGIGVAIGSRSASHSSPAASVVTMTERSRARVLPANRPTASPAPTRASAVAAAAHAITAFNGGVLLDPRRVQTVLARIAATKSRTRLTAAFEEASAETRTKLGVGTVPAPVIVLRSVPVGFRVERFSRSRSTVAVWYVGIVGSGATVTPQQSWRTEVVTLVWETDQWKVSSFRSVDGPTPPLSTAEVPATPGQLFTAIPRFEEFSSDHP